MKTDRIGLRLSPDQKDKLRQAAERERLSVTGYIVAAATTVADREPFLTPEEIDALDQLREQLRRAGVNLNTLLRELQAFNVGSARRPPAGDRTEVHTSELQSLMRISYAVFCLKKTNN